MDSTPSQRSSSGSTEGADWTGDGQGPVAGRLRALAGLVSSGLSRLRAALTAPFSGEDGSAGESAGVPAVRDSEGADHLRPVADDDSRGTGAAGDDGELPVRYRTGDVPVPTRTRGGTPALVASEEDDRLTIEHPDNPDAVIRSDVWEPVER
ncbi:hypothetical protein BRC83_08765 [Halobacteriales archaeon QS_1_68_17]|nr:MAG: hypothetical protein BRC83_08765 [Halobacteriales archaeon QS_1_68_17]